MYNSNTSMRGDDHQRDFKGAFIPKEIWCNPELDGDAKLVWGEIYALDNDFGCIASNEHFMQMFGWKNDRKVQREIKKLADMGLISVEIDKRNDSRTIRVLASSVIWTRRRWPTWRRCAASLISKFKL